MTPPPVRIYPSRKPAYIGISGLLAVYKIYALALVPKCSWENAYCIYGFSKKINPKKCTLKTDVSLADNYKAAKMLQNWIKWNAF